MKMKTLIVDDNTLNLKVAQRIVEQEGLEVDTANSGFECLDMVKQNQYDIIFMDIMMPEMDGVETLKKLKEIENFNTPVVTLTADAKVGSEEKYLNEGFNAYLTKPIIKEKLDEVLNSLLSADKKETVKDTETKKDSQDGATKGNIEYLKANDIDVDVSIELLGDIEMYNQTLKDFIEESKSRIPRIIKNKMSRNMKDYSIDVHAMKSDSKYLGFKKLAELSYEHEIKSKEEDSNFVTLHFDELIDEYERISEIMKKYL